MNATKYPWPMLQPGDRVAVIAPSGPADPDGLVRGLERIESWGLVPVLGDALKLGRGPDPARILAAPDVVRIRDLQRALTDDSNAAVFVARGGYGLLRILDAIDWSRVRNARPRPVVGLSDATCLHVALRVHAHWPSIMGPHVAGGLGAERPDSLSIDALRAMLFAQTFAGTDLLANAAIARPGSVMAPMHGGNLATLASMVGGSEGVRPHVPFIAVLEDINEAPYRVDRMLTQLLRSGWFTNAVGVVCGSWKGCGNVDPVLLERLDNVPGPLVLHAAFGHDDRHLAVPLGIPVRLHTSVPHIEVVGSP
jgi:muramoyltetrapeptide carboxypeptidase